MTGLKQRLWVPCRVCGTHHKNPASSSICTTCGAAEAEERRKRDLLEQEEAREHGARAVEARLRQLEAAETVDDLKEWIERYLL